MYLLYDSHVTPPANLLNIGQKDQGRAIEPASDR